MSCKVMKFALDSVEYSGVLGWFEYYGYSVNIFNTINIETACNRKSALQAVFRYSGLRNSKS